MSATWKKSSILHSPPWKNSRGNVSKGYQPLDRRARTHPLSERITLLPGTLVVLVERCLEDRGIELHLLGESFAGIESLHKTTTNVVLTVPLDFLGSLAVEDESDGVLAVLPNAGARVSKERGQGKWRERNRKDLYSPSCYVIASSKFICESLAFVIKQETTDTTEGLGSKELDLGLQKEASETGTDNEVKESAYIWLLRVDETCRVHLHLFHVDCLGTSLDSHLVAIPRRVLAVGRR